MRVCKRRAQARRYISHFHCEVDGVGDAKWQEAVRRFVARYVEHGERLLAAPRAQQDCHSYCARCWSQYLSHAGECADCDGLPLRPPPQSAPDAGLQVSASLEPKA